jgi:hypothetical protein
LGQRKRTHFFLPEHVDQIIEVHLRPIPGDSLRDHHLYHSDHAPPSNVLALVGQSPIGKPNNLLEIVVEINAALPVIGLSEEVGPLSVF